MANNFDQIKVEELLDLEVLQSLQDGFTSLSGLSVAICRTDGILLTRPSLGNNLCRLFHDQSESKSKCLESVIAAAKMISKLDQIQTVECFAGLTLFAAPIVVEGQRLATIVVCSNPCLSFQDRPLEEISRLTGLPAVEIKQALAESPRLAAEQLEASIMLLHSLATTLAKLSLREYQLRQRLKELTILHNLTSLLAGRADLDQILKITAEQVVKVVEGKGCSIRTYNPDTKELQIKAVANLSPEYLRKGPLKLERSPVDQAALAGEPVFMADMLTDPRVIYKKEAEQEGIRSGLAVGMIYRGQAVGVIHIYRSESRPYDRFETECLKAIASQGASAIINAQLYQEALESERMQRQLKLAAEVQGRMLPRKSPNFPNIQIGSIFEPSYQVGGDFFDFQEFPNGQLGIVIADVAGKGIPASLQMASLRATIRAYIDQAQDLETLVKMVDKAFHRDCLTGEFATLIMGIIDPQKGTLTYVNAGHNPALLVRNHLVEQLKVSGPALAIFDNPKFPMQTIQLEPADRIVLYTDGIIDALNFDQACFSLDRLIASINKYAELAPQKMAENILWDVRRFIGLATQADDMTLMAIKFNPEPKEPTPH
jgi:phosphoserine phosphatase RsbU/P